MIPRALGRLARALFGQDEAALSPDALRAAAVRATGLSADALGAPGLGEALEVLTASLVAEARLSPFGRLATTWDLRRLLQTLLVLADMEARDPAILARRLAPPIFVTGLPRSGTTFLHGLLAAEPGHRAPLVWETIHPYPDHPAAGRGAGPRRVQRQLRMFEMFSPGLGRLHPMDAGAPQECTEITSHVFRSLRFDTTHNVPGYRAWLDRTGHDEAYRFEARFLRHLQGRGERPPRFVLKSPDHVFALDALGRVFPDAFLVLMHRDPAHVLASVARLTEALRAPFTEAIDRHAIGRKVAEDWQDGMRRMTALPDSERIAHVRYRDLVTDPVGTVARIHARFGLPFEAAARAAVAARVARQPDGGYGVNRYRPEEYGISPAVERERAEAYMRRFGIQAEA